MEQDDIARRKTMLDYARPRKTTDRDEGRGASRVV